VSGRNMVPEARLRAGFFRGVSTVPPDLRRRI
jgi:hypothetical protein